MLQTPEKILIDVREKVSCQAVKRWNRMKGLGQIFYSREFSGLRMHSTCWSSWVPLHSYIWVLVMENSDLSRDSIIFTNKSKEKGWTNSFSFRGEMPWGSSGCVCVLKNMQVEHKLCFHCDTSEGNEVLLLHLRANAAVECRTQNMAFAIDKHWSKVI